MKTIVLLTLSNIFMNLAWYAHLKFRNSALFIAILASWGIALLNTSFKCRRTASVRINGRCRN